MSINYIGTTFPSEWLWSKYEKKYLTSIIQQIDQQYYNQKNLVINLTWFGPQFANGPGWTDYLMLIQNKLLFENLFLICTVDPTMINPDQIDDIVKSLGNPKVFKIGNFDTEYQFNFFAPVLVENFNHYNETDLILTNPTWLYINYNRKPRSHRVELVNMLRTRGLDKFGLITLGKPNRIYDCNPDNDLYLSLGENPKDYIKYGHWYNPAHEDEFGIPHDVLSLHNIKFWQEHFLHIIGATEFNFWDNIFVSETQFKPIIGLRPFLINGNIRTYQWLIDQGFRTFNRWFPGINFEDPETVHDSICQAIVQLSKMSKSQILDMYNQMLPDLIHNKHRFYEFAKEQEHKIFHLFDNI